jgi:hypothetical protein
MKCCWKDSIAKVEAEIRKSNPLYMFDQLRNHNNRNHITSTELWSSFKKRMDKILCSARIKNWRIFTIREFRFQY